MASNKGVILIILGIILIIIGIINGSNTPGSAEIYFYIIGALVIILGILRLKGKTKKLFKL